MTEKRLDNVNFSVKEIGNIIQGLAKTKLLIRLVFAC